LTGRKKASRPRKVSVDLFGIILRLPVDEVRRDDPLREAL
jgi:hypothetical protein